jgi:LemA protein
MLGYIILGLVLLIIATIALYNSIVRRRNETDNAFSSIDVILKKRFDLIPNLVETVKRYMDHESSVFKDIADLRSSYTGNLSKNDKINLNKEISDRVKDVMFLVENYPDLKASQNFLHLQSSWNELEEQISAARRYYSSAVTRYNNSVQTFPSNLIAKLFNFRVKKVFESDESERKNVNAKVLFD